MTSNIFEILEYAKGQLVVGIGDAPSLVESLVEELEKKVVLNLDGVQWNIFDDIQRERDRQDEKWGSQRNLDLPVWMSILTEEVGEAATEVNDANFFKTSRPNPCWLISEYEEYNEIRSRLRKELVQVAAVAVAMIEALDRNS